MNRGGALVLLGVENDRAVALLEDGSTLLEAALDEGLGWAPLGGSARRGLSHHLVDLLKRQTLGLGNQEVSVDERNCAETTPNEEHGRAKVTLVRTDHVGSDNSDDGVPEPVGGSGQGNTTRTNGQREDLTDEDPGTRTPGSGEEEDEDGDEGDLSVDGRDVASAGGTISEGDGLVETNGNTDDGDKELADQHAKSAVQQKCATAELLHTVEGERSGADVDQGEDQGDQEGVGDGASRLEERCGVVEDEVDTGPLLHHLERGTEDGLAKVGVGLEEGTLETVGPARDPATSGDEFALVLLVGNDLSELKLDQAGEVSVRGVDTTDLHQGLASILGAATLDEVARRVGQAGDTTTENNTPGELDTDRNAVLASVTAALDAVVDAGGKQKADSNAELVAGDERTTDLLGTDLRHVENDDGRLETDTDTSDSTTSDQEVTTTGSNLENHT